MNNVEILQYGEGNFLRCFAEYKLQKAKNRGAFCGTVAMVSPRSGVQIPLFEAQNNRYTIIIRGLKDGAPVEEVLPVNVVAHTVHPATSFARYRAAYLPEGLKLVISNTTEAGIVTDPSDTPEGTEGTFPAKVTRMLYDRYMTLGADSGLDFLPCELIERNGEELKKCVLWYAEAWNLGAEFYTFVQANNRFYNTLVDRIVTGFPKGNPAEYYSLAGWEDKLLTVGEPYFLWVIEGDSSLAAHYPWLDDPEIVFAPSLHPYRERKVRILNGLHTMGVPVALLAGVATVGEAVKTPAIRSFWERCAKEEIMPSLDLPQREKEAYLKQIFDRFSNPSISHAFRSIALNSISKWKTRVLPALKDYAAKNGTPPRGLTFSLAALLSLYKKDPAVISDAAGIREVFERAVPLREQTDGILKDASWWGESLAEIKGLSQMIINYIDIIEKQTMTDALETVWENT